MATVGVAAVAALKVVGGGKDEIGAVIVEVFRREFVARRFSDVGGSGLVCTWHLEQS
jgi:hypothetical protein